ncbi:MAG: hypothetical protein NE334_01885 [Lentisphaeraceae bacterium]|nr:hypothetical protein [Lentisphaeraceae bacterium]
MKKNNIISYKNLLLLVVFVTSSCTSNSIDDDCLVSLTNHPTFFFLKESTTIVAFDKSKHSSVIVRLENDLEKTKISYTVNDSSISYKDNIWLLHKEEGEMRNLDLNLSLRKSINLNEFLSFQNGELLKSTIHSNYDRAVVMIPLGRKASESLTINYVYEFDKLNKVIITIVNDTFIDNDLDGSWDYKYSFDSGQLLLYKNNNGSWSKWDPRESTP